MNNDIKLLKRECLILDIETWAEDEEGNPIDIKREFDKYLEFAQPRVIGFYSYKTEQYYCIKVEGNEELIQDFIDQHETIIGFNSDAFDIPVLKLRDLYGSGNTDDYKNWKKEIDIQVAMGNNKFLGHKQRAMYMGYSLKGNSLRAMAEVMELETLKGDIDYKIFKKTEWTEEEWKLIEDYTIDDIKVTKLIFDEMCEFWEIFTDWLYPSDIANWSWIKSSIASLTYKSACKTMSVEATYGHKGESEDMGGRAINPPAAEAWDLWYLDEASKYPHTFAEFGLFNEVDITEMDPNEVERLLREGILWHGNEKFKVKGYYRVDEEHPLAKDVIHKLKTRFAIKDVLKNLKKNNGKLTIQIPDIIRHLIKDPENITKEEIKKLKGLEYAIKIFLNALYGAVRSAIFELIHSKNAGYDCCWIGQQIHEYIEKYFAERGYPAMGGFTDSWFFKAKSKDEKDLILKMCEECMAELKKYMPFPAETHKIAIECYMDYVMYHWDPKEKRYLKNNYFYITEGKQKIVGYPIKKSNASKLAPMIYEKYLKPRIEKENRAKFDPQWLIELVDQEIKVEDAVQIYDCKPAHAYKPRKDKMGVEHPSSNIYVQISRTYTDGLGGKVQIIKNKKAGRLGPAVKKIAEGKKIGKNDWFYGTPEECVAAEVGVEDLDKSKIYNELSPFSLEHLNYLGKKK